MNEIIGVVGAGTMGNGIAQTAANAGFEVVMCDIKQEFVERGVQNISKSLDRFVKKETMTEDNKFEILKRIRATTDFESLKDCSLIVEAASENFDVKKGIFAELDNLTAPETILSSNTSSISITKIAATTKRPDKVVGIFFISQVTFDNRKNLCLIFCRANPRRHIFLEADMDDISDRRDLRAERAKSPDTRPTQ
jgi:3-hydroxybutyryl-CoA dehydrogenase